MYPAGDVSRVYVLGTESLGREVAAILSLARWKTKLHFLDDAPALRGMTVSGVPVVGPFARWEELVAGDAGFYIAIGRSEVRQQWMDRIEGAGGRLISAIHPGACVMPSATVGSGSMINYGCHIGPNATVGRGNLLWSSVTISHDCTVGDYCFFGPGASVGGYARIGSHSMIGVNASLRSDISVGERSVVGMGAVVTRDVAEKMFVRTTGKVEPITDAAAADIFFKPHSTAARRLDSAVKSKG